MSTFSEVEPHRLRPPGQDVICRRHVRWLAGVLTVSLAACGIGGTTHTATPKSPIKPPTSNPTSTAVLQTTTGPSLPSTSTTTAPTTTAAPTTTTTPTTTSTTSPTTAAPAHYKPGQLCPLGQGIPNCIDPSGYGQGVYLINGDRCIASNGPPERNIPHEGPCSDIDGDGIAGVAGEPFVPTTTTTPQTDLSRYLTLVAHASDANLTDVTDMGGGSCADLCYAQLRWNKQNIGWAVFEWSFTARLPEAGMGGQGFDLVMWSPSVDQFCRQIKARGIDAAPVGPPCGS